jgi:hypothetical protein
VTNNEQAVRDAALALSKAITEATTAGYRIAWPSNVAGLDTIAISETGAVKQQQPESAAKPAAKPFDDTKVF